MRDEQVLNRLIAAVCLNRLNQEKISLSGSPMYVQSLAVC
jgi:hypothetical protein